MPRSRRCSDDGGRYSDVPADSRDRGAAAHPPSVGTHGADPGTPDAGLQRTQETWSKCPEWPRSWKDSAAARRVQSAGPLLQGSSSLVVGGTANPNRVGIPVASARHRPELNVRAFMPYDVAQPVGLGVDDQGSHRLLLLGSHSWPPRWRARAKRTATSARTRPRTTSPSAGEAASTLREGRTIPASARATLRDSTAVNGLVSCCSLVVMNRTSGVVSCPAVWCFLGFARQVTQIAGVFS